MLRLLRLLVFFFTRLFCPRRDLLLENLALRQGWQAPANNSALFQFFMGGSLEASFTVTLAPDQLFQFDLPGNNFVANRVVVTNLTSGDMTFDDAGAAHAIGRSLVPEPSTLVMLGTGLVGVLGAARRKLRP